MATTVAAAPRRHRVKPRLSRRSVNKKKWQITVSGEIECRSACLPCTTGRLHGRLKSPISWLLLRSSSSIITVAPCHGQPASATGRHASRDAGETSAALGDGNKVVAKHSGLPVRWKSRRRDRRRPVPTRLKAGDSGDVENGWRLRRLRRFDGDFSASSPAMFALYWQTHR